MKSAILRLCLVIAGTISLQQFAFAGPPAETTTYCVRSHDGAWKQMDYQPLIDVHAGQTIAKATYQGSVLISLRLRTFTPEYELAFEYQFSQDGAVSGVNGTLTRWGKWVYEASTFHRTTLGMSPVKAQYARIAGGLPIGEPEDGHNFAAKLQGAPAFESVAEIPCSLPSRPYEVLLATK